MKFSELVELVGEVVTVEVVPSYFEDGTTDIQGELAAANPRNGIVLNTTSRGTIIIGREFIVDVRKGVPIRKMVRRKIATIPEVRLRQHLLDRHAVPWSIAKVMTPATASRLHDSIDHSDLGHRHVPEGEGEEE